MEKYAKKRLELNEIHSETIASVLTLKGKKPTKYRLKCCDTINHSDPFDNGNGHITKIYIKTGSITGIYNEEKEIIKIWINELKNNFKLDLYKIEKEEIHNNFNFHVISMTFDKKYNKSYLVYANHMIRFLYKKEVLYNEKTYKLYNIIKNYFRIKELLYISNSEFKHNVMSILMIAHYSAYSHHYNSYFWPWAPLKVNIKVENRIDIILENIKKGKSIASSVILEYSNYYLHNTQIAKIRKRNKKNFITAKSKSDKEFLNYIENEILKMI